ncbi:prepilin-type N-terminal cleavage/methylation domain-containing protein [bacterium]|nr:prepilin-type N-terminal cleavage/methylation domain-containing protein [bacterium]
MGFSLLPITKENSLGLNMTDKTKRNPINDSSGFTLVEVMVALTILIMVIIPLASFYAVSLSTIQRSLLYSQALQLCRERVEFCAGIEYDALFYWNPALTPGFEMGPQINMNRDPDTSDGIDVYSYDPTAIAGTYPIPIYRDYYNNSTGMLIDPNYNGLCDDDLDGDGEYGVIDGDLDDIALANPNGAMWTDNGVNVTDLPQFMQDFDSQYGGLQRAGDGLYDTVIEGIYANAFDPWLFGTRSVLRGDPDLTEEVSPIIDFSLQFNSEQDIPIAGADYRHREQTFRTFARMTTVIDPTPILADPNIAHIDAYADSIYLQRRILNDGWQIGQQIKFALCTQRDLPLNYSLDNRSVGIDRQGFDGPFVNEDYAKTVVNPFTQNYTYPLYGKRIIVTVFFLSGEGEQEDLNGDGFPDGETFATSNNVRMERVFYNTNLLGGASGGLLPQVSRYDDVIYENTGRLVHLTSGDDESTDPCSWENSGLPYLDDDWPGNL